MILVLQGVIFFILFVASYYVVRRDMFRYDTNVPVLPWNLPWIGNLIQSIIYRRRMLEWLLENAKKYNGPFYFALPLSLNQLVLVINDPPSIKHVLLDNFPNYNLPDLRKRTGKKLLGHGIFQVDGKNWEALRELAQPVFKINVRKQMAKIFQEESSTVVSILRSTKSSFDFQELMKKMTIDAFAKIGFGTDLGVLSQEVPFCKDYDWVLGMIEEELFNPLLQYYRGRECRMRLERMEKYVFEIIERRKKEGWQGKLDLISILLETGQDPVVIRDSLFNFFVAGRDTTACLLTWSFYYFSEMPQVRAKVKEEIDQHLGDTLPDFENIKNLRYLRMVLDEVLRLHPPALPVNFKQAVNDDVLPNGVKVKAGQVVSYSPYVTQRLEKYWEKDSNLFCPERWEDSEVSKNPYIFLPFQRGPRTCLGREMAYEEASIVTCVLLQSGIELKVVPGQIPNQKNYFPAIFSMNDGLQMSISVPKSSS